MTIDSLSVYGTNWCGDCRRARRLLDKNDVLYTFINIDLDKEAEKLVKSINHGMRSVPTIIFPDGSILVEPTNKQLAEKLGIELDLPKNY